jgi:hypothetical protein
LKIRKPKAGSKVISKMYYGKAAAFEKAAFENSLKVGPNGPEPGWIRKLAQPKLRHIYAI